ncbi:hypothetical protein GUJ93_ZPchr0034g18710 [Zizania palustris]|uniref:Uncharacterized protein n=1 Tax=Zizania palustris TaxID=103762 RepID=A0A8J5RGL6_ZIZPA|nr:hypothetical protein GUJ93_ZPchr0034g18710 [Zizania palustris]
MVYWSCFCPFSPSFSLSHRYALSAVSVWSSPSSSSHPRSAILQRQAQIDHAAVRNLAAKEWFWKGRCGRPRLPLSCEVLIQGVGCT